MSRRVVQGGLRCTTTSPRIPVVVGALFSTLIPSRMSTNNNNNDKSTFTIGGTGWQPQSPYLSLSNGRTLAFSTQAASGSGNSSSNSSSSSSSSGSERGGIRGWFEDRNKRKQEEQYMEQMKRLSEMKELTLQSYKEELERGLNQWGAKISFLQTKEVKMAQEIVKVVQALITVKGGQATADDLFHMDRLERLKVATSSNKTVEELSMLISQIQNMDLMQKTLRKRHLEGKPIPPDPTAMQAAIKKDAMSLMSKAQKEEMMKRQATMAKRSRRKRS